MSRFPFLGAWKKKSSDTSGEESRTCTQPLGDANNTCPPPLHAPDARGSSLFQEFMNNGPSSLGPAFGDRLAVVSTLEEQRAWSGANGYTPVQYVSRPFPGMRVPVVPQPLSEPSTSTSSSSSSSSSSVPPAPLPPGGPMCSPYHSYDIADHSFVEQANADHDLDDHSSVRAPRRDQGRDLTRRRSPRRIWPPAAAARQTTPELESHRRSSTCSSLDGSGEDGNVSIYNDYECPFKLRGMGSEPQFDLTSKMALGLITSTGAGAVANESPRSSSLASSSPSDNEGAS